MIRTIGFACVALFWGAVAQAQECSQLLTHGIYDVRSSASDLNTASSYSSWFCDQRFSSSEQANDFGASLGFPFKGVPVKLGFNSSSGSWSEWYSNFCSSVQQDKSLQSRVLDQVQTVNPQIVQAFNTCIANDGLHVWLERTYDPKTFIFAARFNPPNRTNPVAMIDKFDPGPNVKCKDYPIDVDRAEWRTRCVRTNDKPVSIVITANWAPHGGGKLTLPEIAKYDQLLCPNLAGVWYSSGNNVTMSISQKTCEISSTFGSPTHSHVLKSNYANGEEFGYQVERITVANGCKTVMHGRFTGVSSSAMSSQVLGTDGRCDLPTGFKETLSWSRQ